MKNKLKFECIFCGEPTNFKETKIAYCIDCYAKVQAAKRPVIGTAAPTPAVGWPYMPVYYPPVVYKVVPNTSPAFPLRGTWGGGIVNAYPNHLLKSSQGVGNSSKTAGTSIT